MKKFIVPICLILLIGAAALWYFGGLEENTKSQQIDLSPKPTETEGIEQHIPPDLDASQKEILTLLKQMRQIGSELKYSAQEMSAEEMKTKEAEPKTESETVLEKGNKIRTLAERILQKTTEGDVKYLKTLSLEEQTAYFKRIETQVYNNSRNKQREVRDPGSLDKSWNRNLQRHIDAGYTLPDGIDFK